MQISYRRVNKKEYNYLLIHSSRPTSSPKKSHQGTHCHTYLSLELPTKILLLLVNFISKQPNLSLKPFFLRSHTKKRSKYSIEDAWSCYTNFSPLPIDTKYTSWLPLWMIFVWMAKVGERVAVHWITDKIYLLQIDLRKKNNNKNNVKRVGTHRVVNNIVHKYRKG